jgi:hypothetical protein
LTGAHWRRTISKVASPLTGKLVVPQSIPAGLTKEHVLLALAELDAGAAHPFGQPTRYEVIHQGSRYAPKAVVGLACRHHLGRALQPDEFSGGEAPGQANHVLRRLGFTVVRKGEPAKVEEGAMAGEDWSEPEVYLTVADYFAMLRKELLGEPYSKTEHRKALVPQLNDRSDGSVEYKHQNISAVLLGRGLPYINGYKPASNFQALLAQAVESYLANHAGYLEQLAASPALDPDSPAPAPEGDLEEVIVAPPDHIVAPEPSKPWLSRRARRIDFVERDAANRRLGRLGEEFVVEVERLRLRQAGRDDLAAKVDWVSQSIGDGLGFDVLSFEEADGAERLVEVKTTGLGIHFPFYVTANEVRCSENMAARFHLYRVFDFARSPKLYILAGALPETCKLEPVQYRARL